MRIALEGKSLDMKNKFKVITFAALGVAAVNGAQAKSMDQDIADCRKYAEATTQKSANAEERTVIRTAGNVIGNIIADVGIRNVVGGAVRGYGYQKSAEAQNNDMRSDAQFRACMRQKLANEQGKSR